VHNSSFSLKCIIVWVCLLSNALAITFFFAIDAIQQHVKEKLIENYFYLNHFSKTDSDRPVNKN
jgi:hypothetical protein